MSEFIQVLRHLHPERAPGGPERSEDTRSARSGAAKPLLEGVGKVLTARHLLSAAPVVAWLPHVVSAPHLQQRQRSLPRLRAPSTEALSIRVIAGRRWRSEEHTSELQSRGHLVCRLLLEKK